MTQTKNTDKLTMHTPNLVDSNINKVAELFPNVITEQPVLDDEGNPKTDQAGNPLLQRAIDFELLKQELSHSVVDGSQERYRLDWVGKRQSILEANTPIAKTLRPVRAESVNFDNTENLFIEGDNLEALKLLQESYLGKVKMIYIDPPYNTGNDFIYADDFSENTEEFLERSNQVDEDGNRLVANTESNGRFHSDWLTMMYSRLKLARNLLRDDGVMVVHIDENEYPNLEKILAEVFGQNNNLGTIVWDKRNPKGDARGIAQQHELISFYCKNIETFKNKVDFIRPKENAEKMLKKAEQLISKHKGVNETVRKEYKDWLKQQDVTGGEKAYNQIDDSGNIFQSVSMAWPNKKQAPEDYFVPLIHPVTNKKCVLPDRGWRSPSKTMQNLLQKDLILFGSDETSQPRRKYFLKENMFENISSLLYYGGSDDALLKELGVWFDTPKVVNVSRKLIQSICSQNDLILDFFAGSATTAHAVMDLNAQDGGNRKFIMVQIPEQTDKKSEAHKAGYNTIAEISKERIRRAGNKIVADNADKDGIENLDIGFRVLKIDSTNMADVYYTPDQYSQDMLDQLESNIKADRTAEDLLFQVMLDWGVPLSLPITSQTIAGQTVYSVGGNSLVACFDEISTELVAEVAKLNPLKFVSCESAIVRDEDKSNIKERFKQLSKDTDVKFI